MGTLPQWLLQNPAYRIIPIPSHTQMDGAHAATFLGKLQDVINSI